MHPPPGLVFGERWPEIRAFNEEITLWSLLQSNVEILAASSACDPWGHPGPRTQKDLALGLMLSCGHSEIPDDF